MGMKRQRERDESGAGSGAAAAERSTCGPSIGDVQSVREFGKQVLRSMREIQHMKEQNVGAIPLVWVDCDPGGDDCFALMWLFALQNKGHCKVIGISTSEGNVRAPLTYAAADKVAMICQAEAQICAQTPLHARFGTKTERREARLQAKLEAVGDRGGDAAHIHGTDGMGGLSNRMHSSGKEYEDADESYEALSEALFRYPRQLVLLVIGPHTNLHDAEKHEPGIMMLTRDIIIMGGAFNVHGNITPNAEFNIWKVLHWRRPVHAVRRMM
jgi:inosine-uridine nucleoside N-ribohydrolase